MAIRLASSQRNRAVPSLRRWVEGDAVLLRAHGAVLAAAGLLEVFMACIHFEENARAHILASRLGELAPLTEEEIAALEASWPEGFRQHYASKIWRYYVTKGMGTGLIPKAWSGDPLP